MGEQRFFADDFDEYLNIGPQPVVTIAIPAKLPSGDDCILLRLDTPSGRTWAFYDIDTAENIGLMLVRLAREERAKQIVVPTPDIPGMNGGVLLDKRKVQDEEATDNVTELRRDSDTKPS